MNRSAALLATAAMCLALSTCMFYKTEVGVVDKDAAPELKDFSVKSPTKLHLKDGSVVLYDKGFEVIGKNIVGEGEHYDLTRSAKTTVAGVATDEVAYLEYYDRKNRRTLSTLASAAAATTGVVGGVLLAKALFGSCPTVYAESGQDRQLQAELFSHSISPGFEMQDLDRLQGIRQVGNSVSLLVANEALETHYINRANLLVVDHLPGYEALPAGDGEVLLLGGAAQLLEARSRSGVDVRELVAHRDDSAYQSGADLLSAFVERAEPDWIDLSIAVPAAAHQMYVMVRVRNTLLATVFLYDVAMAQQGFYAIDWMAADSAEPAYAARFAQWFNRGFGLSIERLDDGAYRQVGLLAPTGPIAWKQAAHPVEVAGPTQASLRLSFTPDNWAIDWVGVSFVSTAAVQQHRIAPHAIEAVRGNGYSDRAGLLAEADNDYLVTYPGDIYRLSFEVPPVKDGLQRSYLLVSRGYYVEWMRMNWIAGGPGGVTDRPMEFDDALLQRTARLWLEKRQDMQVRFYETRLPLDGDWR